MTNNLSVARKIIHLRVGNFFLQTMEDIVSLLDHSQKKTPFLLSIVQSTPNPARNRGNFFAFVFAQKVSKSVSAGGSPQIWALPKRNGVFSAKAFLRCIYHLFLTFLVRFFVWSQLSLDWIVNQEPYLYMYESLTVNILAAIKSSYEIWVGLMVVVVGGWSWVYSVPFRCDLLHRAVTLSSEESDTVSPPCNHHHCHHFHQRHNQCHHQCLTLGI